MKVIVRCANNRVTKAEMEREIERLFQENKDLRLSESHLKDELNLVSQQSEVRRQKMVEKDKEIDRMRATIANVGADRDNFEAAYKQVLQWWEAAQSKATEAEAAADEYRIAAMESDCRVNELEKQLEWVRNKNEEWAAVAQGLRNTIEEMKAQKEADDKKSEEICTACNERYEDVLAERNRLREEVARLTTERDTSVSENSELIFTINELQDKLEVERNLRVEAEKAYDKVASEAYDMHQQITNLTIDNTRLKNKVEELSELEADYDALVQTKREYGEEIDRLRRVVTELQTNRFTMGEIKNMICKYLENHEPSSASFNF